MRPLITRFVAGFIALGAPSLAVVGAQAFDSPNGPDAGIGIPGYNQEYSYSASGLPPGATRPHYRRYSYRRYGPHNGYYRHY